MDIPSTMLDQFYSIVCLHVMTCAKKNICILQMNSLLKAIPSAKYVQ